MAAAVTMTLLIAMACGGASSQTAEETATPRPIPSPVTFRQEPEGVTLGDPAFEALPGARADSGRLGGSVYQIEMPDNWNGRLVLYMHGYGELAPEAQVSAPGVIRTYLILHGYAWGASSFSSTSSIPGRSADETAALWDFFVQKYGRPQYTYVTGQSMGGGASHIAAERYADRFDGALALCGSAGQTAGAAGQADFFAAAAYVAGVTQADFDASTDAASLIQDRILPALENPVAHAQWEDIMLDLTGGPRAFDREGFHFEEETNWGRAQTLVAARLAPNAGTAYQLGPLSTVSSDEFNRAVIRLPTNDELMRTFTEGEDTTGDLQIPLLSLHTTGDGQVPIQQAQILYDASMPPARAILVQRVFRDPGHWGLRTRSGRRLAALMFAEQGKKPDGENVLVDDLRSLTGKFELAPVPDRRKPIRSWASDRVVVSGVLPDGAPLTRDGWRCRRSRWAGTPCRTILPEIQGRHEIGVLAETEARLWRSGRGGLPLDEYAEPADVYPAATTVAGQRQNGDVQRELFDRGTRGWRPNDR
jgi:pimeloyl-ACP methyl ester carboxylesterase